MIITFVYTAEVSQTALLEFAALTMIDEILFYESTGCTMKTSTHRLKSLSLFFGRMQAHRIDFGSNPFCHILIWIHPNYTKKHLSLTSHGIYPHR